MTTKPIPSKMTHDNIADPFVDLLAVLDEGARQGFVSRLAVGYYDGWRPTRAEVARLIDLEAGRVSEDEYLALRRSTDTAPITAMASTGAPNGQGADARAAADQSPVDQGPPRVDCGALASPLRFIAVGLAHGDDVAHEGVQYRRISLRYELIPASIDVGDAVSPVFFTAPIFCIPDVPMLRTAHDGQTMSHRVESNAIVGCRGSWAIREDARQLKFLIHAQSTDGRHSRHAAGSLWMELGDENVAWHPVGPHRRLPRPR